MYIIVTPQNLVFFEKLTVANLARNNLLKYRDLSLIYVTRVSSTPQVQSLCGTAGDIITCSSRLKPSKLSLFQCSTGY
jgi:hypothetical protein